MGPAYRDADQLGVPFGTSLPSERLQYETACAALQSKAVTLEPGAATSWTFFGFYEPDHPAASSDSDLTQIEIVEDASKDWAPRELTLSAPPRSLLHDARSAVAEALDEKAIKARYRRRTHVERVDGQLLSFFVPGRTHSRHVVLRDKEHIVPRRHGALIRSGQSVLPDEAILCATAWMHGVFGAQLTIGNTSFHKLFSVSRDPYNITRASGLRMLMETKDGWRLLTVPSAFEMGLSDCRWIYQLGQRTVTVSATVSGDEPAMQWRVTLEGPRCRFLVFGHLVLGEQEYGPAGRIEIDSRRKRFTFRPDLNDRWGQQYPEAVYRLVTSTPGRVEAVGGDELLYADGKRRSGGYAAIRTRPTNEFAFAVVGSMTRCKAGRRAGVKIREAGRRSSDAQAQRSLLAQPHARRSRGERQGFRRCACRRHDLPLARARRDDPSHRAARSRTIYRRRVGHARRLPGLDRTPADARA